TLRERAGPVTWIVMLACVVVYIAMSLIGDQTVMVWLAWPFDPGEICGLRKAGDAVQFNIGIAFPNCWDGVNLKPTHSHNNAIYA
ncbi:hypothetical protein MJI37_33225, partial [Salmonella enterica subsp. enterica serovar Cerro]|nr:hypothetical protein [Salmonella enterica subsp. enterica serovar Cerro]